MTTTTTTVQQLAQVRSAPAVSILCPFDTRRPGNLDDAAVLAGLRTAAIRDAQSLSQRIDDALATIDLDHPTPGVGVFVSSDLTCVIPLDAAVPARVAVSDRFAMRELLTAIQEVVDARAVVLSQGKTRCVDLHGRRVVERHDHGFPVAVSAPVEADTPHRNFPLDEHEHDEAARFVFRAVDRALQDLQHADERPLVLFGVERDLAYFEELTANHTPIAGRVRGNHEHASLEAIAGLARPVLDAHRREVAERACHDAREAISTHAVAGIDATLEAARGGRGYRLLVEADFTYPAPAGNGSVDAVEDTIHETLGHDGEVVVVPEGALRDLDHIVLVTRY
jgi:hypothetical protein